MAKIDTTLDPEEWDNAVQANTGGQAASALGGNTSTTMTAATPVVSPAPTSASASASSAPSIQPRTEFDNYMSKARQAWLLARRMRNDELRSSMLQPPSSPYDTAGLNPALYGQPGGQQPFEYQPNPFPAGNDYVIPWMSGGAPQPSITETNLGSAANATAKKPTTYEALKALADVATTVPSGFGQSLPAGTTGNGYTTPFNAPAGGLTLDQIARPDAKWGSLGYAHVDNTGGNPIYDTYYGDATGNPPVVSGYYLLTNPDGTPRRDPVTGQALYHPIAGGYSNGVAYAGGGMTPPTYEQPKPRRGGGGGKSDKKKKKNKWASGWGSLTSWNTNQG